MNLFLTEDGVLKLGAYGLTTQAECYGIEGMNCDGIRSFAPEVFRGEYEMKSDVWSLGTVLIEMMGIRPYAGYSESRFPTKTGNCFSPFDVDAIESASLTNFLKKCFREYDRWSASELMDVSVMG